MTLRSLACAIGLDGLFLRLTLEPLGFHPGALGVRLLLRRGSRRLLRAQFFVLPAAAQICGLLLAPVQFGLLALPAGHHQGHDHDDRDNENNDVDPDPGAHGNPFQTWLPVQSGVQYPLPTRYSPAAGAKAQAPVGKTAVSRWAGCTTPRHSLPLLRQDGQTLTGALLPSPRTYCAQNSHCHSSTTSLSDLKDTHTCSNTSNAAIH